MQIKRIFAASAVTLAALTTLVGCGSGDKKAKAPADTVSFTSKDAVATADSSVVTDLISAQQLMNTMDGLYRYEGKDLKPAMSTKIVKPTNNGTVYTFPLRKDAKWSNGDPVTAQDFVFAWRRTVDPKTKSQYSFIYEGITNAKDITDGKKAVDSLGVKALDKHTLQVTLEKPVPYFDKLMAFQTFFPQNRKVVDKWGKKYGTNSKTLVFNGPYKLQDWSNGDNTWTQVKNNKYWNAKKVKVKKLKYQVMKDASTSLNLYQSGKLDVAELTGDTSKQMKNSKDYTVQKQNATCYLEFNQEKYPIFKNAKIRQAMSMTIDRQQLTKKVLGNGTTAIGPVTAANMAYDPQTKADFVTQTKAEADKYEKQNLKQAKQLWKEGLAETGNTGKKQSFTLLGDDLDIIKKQNEFLQSQLEKLPGLKITVNNVPYKTRLERSQKRDFQLVTTKWSADFPDPINFLTLFTSHNSYNNGPWKNAEYDQLIKKSLGEDANRPEQRWNDMKQAQNILSKEQGVAPLYQDGQAYLVNSRVKHLDYGPGGMYNMVSLRIKDQK
ncbi:peptide ABC transporter substrate-binding protein [Lactobacillus sp. DCY120]|uniref:Peptide ABC transporter substrate-binding protein n=1 Tax=Bombilactobacillus apium TaxID=2675299 RepID=A0A850R8I2_9LACO|nr:peptide ABC transporter substrate-binding protein [Bombilactobacillus apium]NVY97157.1 peptide ABC transporter substrate-binding protein [Bombilactobacillus apium]